MVQPPIVVKIAFVLDCTGSMEPWIYESKTKIQDIIKTNSEVHPNARFEVALVAYRDYGDAERMRIIDFTTPDEIVAVLRDIHAKGGDDEAEDIANALDRACNLTWGPSQVRMVFHIADAPAHGMTYHLPCISDRFPQGDPDGKNPKDILRNLASQNIEYTFVRITSSTDLMIDVFHNVYSRVRGIIRMIDLNPQTYRGDYGPQRENMAELLAPALSCAVSQAVGRYTSSQDM